MSDALFYGVLLLCAVLGLTVIYLDRREQRRTKKKQDQRFDNGYEQARKDRIDAANIAAFYTAPKKGPHGFNAQNERQKRGA